MRYFDRPIVRPLIVGFLGFILAAIGAGLAYVLDLDRGMALAACFFLVACGVAVGFYGIGKGWVAWAALLRSISRSR